MFCPVTILALAISLVIAAGATTALILPFALLECTLAVQSVTLSINFPLQQTTDTTIMEASNVQTKTCLLLDPEPPFGTLESMGLFERMERRWLRVSPTTCGGQQSDCSKYGHPVVFLPGPTRCEEND